MSEIEIRVRWKGDIREVVAAAEGPFTNTALRLAILVDKALDTGAIE